MSNEVERPLGNVMHVPASALQPASEPREPATHGAGVRTIYLLWA